MEKLLKIYRQGDLLLIEDFAQLSENTKVGNALVVESETGNKHVLMGSVHNLHGQLYVVVEKPTPLTHPQHPQLVIEPGIYRVEFVRDYALRRAVD
ncbi:hypothetical protein QPL79_05795 [Ignisphaera sp. 4213-co]|uniref:H/ACA RNA-protein complex protein Gar1 n=1 Tax=Ignisphaera cupida TaxID=3050454 RepID=A0ABD4Z9A2_9CREN|nr:hypothetical protein [Ignisphaera sp. 4213-co]MDK6028870.1 hypothetical protein [Ignisphaera sp. 4213-co]